MNPFLPRTALALLLAATCFGAFAQQQPAAAVSPEKQKLIQRVLQLWHVEDVSVVMVQRPAANAMEQSRVALQARMVSQAKQDATLKDISKDVQKYVDEATPIARETALKLKEPVLAPLLAQNFSEEELRQVIALLESPVKKKFEQLVPQMEKAFGEQVAKAGAPAIDPKLKAMTESVGLKLRATAMTP
jgi:hypothetical protein